MKKTLAAATVVIALLGTAACSHASTGTTAGDTEASCHQQFETWRHGPAHAPGQKMAKVMDELQSAYENKDLLKTESSLKAVGAAATALQAEPIPRCADPKGYWHQMLARLTASGDDVKADSGLSGVLLALEPFKSARGIISKFSAELSKTAGEKYNP